MWQIIIDPTVASDAGRKCREKDAKQLRTKRLDGVIEISDAEDADDGDACEYEATVCDPARRAGAPEGVANAARDTAATVRTPARRAGASDEVSSMAAPH